MAIGGSERDRRVGAGFTLIEVIVAIVILAIGVPSILWALRDSHVRRVDPINFSRARWLASEKIEDILADARSTTRGYGYLVNANYASESPVSGFTGFTRSVSISVCDDNLVAGTGTGFKVVAVTVGCVDGRGASRSVSLSGVVAEN